MGASLCSYLSAARDVLDLELPEFEVYKHWEDAAIHGGFRVLHEEFCLVCDFPEVLKVDENNEPHCEDGPSHRWRDGWSLYHWHGIKVPEAWIMDKYNVDPADVIKCEDVEQRAAGCEILGWDRMVDHLDRKVLDGDPDTDIGALIELTMPDLPEPGRFLQAQCPRNGTIVLGVPRVSDIDNKPIDTVIAAQAWISGEPASTYQHPPIRT